jgi:hypothetical protein
MVLFRKKPILLAGLILLLLGLLALAFWKRPEGRVEALVPGVRHSANGVVAVTVILTNGMPRGMNIVDDINGNPHFALQFYGDPGIWVKQHFYINPGTNSLSLTDGGNQIRIRLAPGQCLTNTVMLTNPPPRFRLMVSVRDFEDREALGLFYLFLSRASFGALDKWLGYGTVERKGQQPVTPWIQIPQIMDRPGQTK